MKILSVKITAGRLSLPVGGSFNIFASAAVFERCRWDLNLGSYFHIYQIYVTKSF